MQSTKNSSCFWVVKTKTNWAHWCCFVQKWLCLKSKLVMFEKPLFFCRFFALDLLTLSFFFLVAFCVFDISCFGCFSLLVVVQKMHQVSTFWRLLHIVFWFLWFHYWLSFGFALFLGGCFLGGFKGQVRWPNGPPHLALNPPYFGGIFFFVFCYFPVLLLEDKPMFPQNKCIFAHLWVSSFVSP